LIDNPSARCNRRISAQSSTDNTPSSSQPIKARRPGRGSSLKGRGRATPDVGLLVTGLLAFPGWVRTNASEGWVSRLDRRSTRAAGLALTPTPSGA
jgi:hypothetical protein